MNKTLKIGLSCFIGGLVLCLVALAVAPAFWWLGIFAGFAAGYLAYEFREVLAAVPVALRATAAAGDRMGVAVTEWFQEPHPLAYPLIPVGVVTAFLIMSSFAYDSQHFNHPLMIILPGIVVSLVFGTLASFVGLALILMLMLAGGVSSDTKMSEITWKYWLHAGRGVVRIAIFLVWGWWTGLIKFAVIFTLELVRLIHSSERLLCGVDGTLGGLVALWAFWTYGPAAASLNTTLFVGLCGGLAGAMLGILNWELVSKRVYGFGQNT